MVLLRPASVALVSLCMAANVAAQTNALPQPSHPIVSVVVAPDALSAGERLTAIQSWTRDFTEWSAWFEQWQNRPEPGWWVSARDRRTAPAPPSWLPGMCAEVLQESGPLFDACHLWHEWIRDGRIVGLLDQQQATVRATHEHATHSLWFEHVHLDALWPMTQAGSSAFGLFGMHVTMQLTDRVGVFLTPGAILMRVPAVGGGSAWSPATDWGFSYRMFDLRLPGVRRGSSAHFNIARVWMLGSSAQPIQGAVYLAGFSLTFKGR